MYINKYWENFGKHFHTVVIVYTARNARDLMQVAVDFFGLMQVSHQVSYPETYDVPKFTIYTVPKFTIYTVIFRYNETYDMAISSILLVAKQRLIF